MFCLLLGGIAGQQGRRVGVRVRPAIQEEEVASQEEAEFYSDEQPVQRPQVQFRQPTLSRAIASEPRIQSTAPRQKTVQEPKPAPVQTIRNYNKLNDDGSFTFGYEAADGSFKEENRGTDCVVRGKYGYIDPDGNKREFTYVSGNPCDPNVNKQEQEEETELPAGSAEENVPANYPQRPLKASRRPPPPERPSTTLFQQQFATQEAIAADEQEEQQQVNIRPRPTIRPTPQFTTVEQQPQIFRASSPAPRPTFAQQPSRATVRFEQPPATTFRPQIQLTTSSPVPARGQPPSASPQPGLDFSAEFKKFQVDLDSLSPSRAPKPAPTTPQGGSSALYQTELIFDPATGQYNTVVFQQVPKTVETPQRSPFSAQPQSQPQFFSPPRQAFSQPPPSAFQQQQLFQQQQAALQVQQSQQLFEQQQEQKRATEPPRIPQNLLRQSPQTFSSQSSQPAPAAAQRFQPEPQPQRFLSDAPSQRFNPASGRAQRFPAEAPPPAQRFSQPAQPQPFFFVASPSDRQAFASGQIDTFLRGHNLQF